jgi:foldase protein PrsA
MMSNVSRCIAGLATAALGLSLLAGCASNAQGGGGDIASVNGQKVSRTDFDTKLEAGPQARQVLTSMVQGMLIDQYAKDNNITIPDADIQKKEDEIKAKYPPGQFEQILKQQNLTETDVKNILRQQLIIEKAVGKNVTITDKQIKDYLDKNHATLDKPEQVRARHILVADLKTANAVEAQLKAGAKFDDLAKKYSTDPSSKDKGGELGFFQKGQMVPAFQDAAYKQKIGLVGPPVKSPFGYHIIQVEERKPAQIASLANSHDSIRDTLKQQQEQTQIPQFLQTLRSKATIVVFDDRLKDAFPSPAPSVPASGAPAPAATSSGAAKSK